jgi:hypothetical protein
MSSPIDDNGSSDRLKYAPPWYRQQLANDDTAATATEAGPSTEALASEPSEALRVRMPTVQPLKVAKSLETTPSASDPSGPVMSFERDRGVRELRARTTLDPHAYPKPAEPKSSRFRWKSVGQTLGIIVFAAGVASVVVIYALPEAEKMAVVRDKFPAAMIAPNTDHAASLEAIRTEPPRLVVIEKRRAIMNEPVPLGVNLTSSSGSSAVLISGLVAETRLSAGAAIGSGTWRVPLADLGQAKVIPPNDFIGIMDITVALLTADAEVADKSAMHVEWITADRDNRAPVSESPSSRDEISPSAAPLKRSDLLTLDREEIEGLVKRGREFIANGDLAAARLVLRRAANGGNPQAAFLLGTTFDPVTFEQLHVIGAAPDPTEARNWYQRAIELGSSETKRRLAPLARGKR